MNRFGVKFGGDPCEVEKKNTAVKYSLSHTLEHQEKNTRKKTQGKTAGKKKQEKHQEKKTMQNIRKKHCTKIFFERCVRTPGKKTLQKNTAVKF